MISNVVQERFNVAPAQVRGSRHKWQRTIGRKLVPLAIGCLTTASMMTIAAPSIAHTVPVQAGHATLATSPLGLSRTQMEQMANILLALIYVVLPIGFSVGLVLHDRHQAQRTATLEAQIKQLEKIWHQSPQG